MTRNKWAIVLVIVLAIVSFGVGRALVAAQPLSLTEFNEMRVQYKVAAHNFSDYFYRVGQNIYSKIGEPKDLGAFSGEPPVVMLEKRLDFSAGATTTAGGLFKITNGRTRMLCDRVELDLYTAGGANSRDLQFSVTTSTSATAISGSGAALIASTTVSTNTSPLITNVRYPGTYVGADQDVGGESWELGAGVSILGSFDAPDASASSTAYTSMAGKVFVRCHAE